MNKTAFNSSDVISLIASIEKDDVEYENVSGKINGIVTGLSGKKFRTLMAKLVEIMPDKLAYMEIGIYQGMTPLVVAASNPDKRVIGVDDFSHFDPNKENIKKINKVIDLLQLQNIEIISKDFEFFLKDNKEKLRKKIGIYYFDASHDYRSQILSLHHAVNYLAEGGIIVVDDCNYPHVRQATIDFISVYEEYKLIFEAYTGKHPFHDFYASFSNKWSADWVKKKIKALFKKPGKSSFEKNGHFQKCVDTWWNGVNIIIHDPNNTIEKITPPIPNDLKEKFLSQHGFAGCNADNISNRIAKLS